MAKMKLDPLTLLQLLTELLNRHSSAMTWLATQPELVEFEVPTHLETTVTQHKDTPGCLLIAREPTDDDALFEVLRLVLGVMHARESSAVRPGTKAGSRKKP